MLPTPPVAASRINTWLKHLSRPEQVLFFALTVLVSVTIAVILSLILTPSAPLPSLGDYESPQCVTNNVLHNPNICTPDGPLPSAYLGDRLTIFGKRCVNPSGDAVSIIIYRTFTRLDVPADQAQVVPGSTRAQEDAAGERICEASPLNIAMPSNLTPGTWRLDGIDLSTKDGSIKVWSSTDFLVLPRPVAP